MSTQVYLSIYLDNLCSSYRVYAVRKERVDERERERDRQRDREREREKQMVDTWVSPVYY